MKVAESCLNTNLLTCLRVSGIWYLGFEAAQLSTHELLPIADTSPRLRRWRLKMMLEPAFQRLSV